MSKLNVKGSRPVPTYKALPVKHVQLETKRAVSMNGNVQWEKEPLQHLYELTVSTLLGKDTFYRSSNELVKNMEKRVADAVKMDALDFVANLAIHARMEMHIRSLPIMLVVQFAKALREQNKQYDHMRQLVCDVIQRADQITDMYAYALEVFSGKGKIPMAIKRGVGDAFNKFNEYHFAKYNRAGAVKFRDVLRIVHPAAKNEKQGALFQKIMQEALETPYTWETELSANGQLPAAERKSDKQLWTELLQSGKLGFMAIRRNLRNIVKAGVDGDVLREHVAAVLADPKRVAESKEFPFSFIQARNAVREVGGNRIIESALDKALALSVNNIPTLGKKLAIIIDKSGSMKGGPSTLPGFTPYDQATTLAAMLIKAHAEIDNLDVIAFGSNASMVTNINPADSVTSICDKIHLNREGGSTSFRAALNLLGTLKVQPDVVFVFTDGEINDLYGVRHTIPANTVKVAVNFQAADSTPFPVREGWYPLAGWSDKMFRFIPAIREKTTIVELLSIPYVGADALKAKAKEEADEE